MCERDLRRRLRESVESVSTQFRSEHGGEDLPQTTIHRFDGQRVEMSQQEVTQPSRALFQNRRLREYVRGQSEGVANWMIETDNGFPTGFRESNRSDTVQFYQGYIDSFLRGVFDYSGGITVNDEQFDKAFSDQIEPLTDRNYSFELLIPLPGLYLQVDEFTIELPFDEIEDHELLVHNIDQATIGGLSPSELSGIYAYEEERNSPTRRSSINGSPDELGLHSRLRVSAMVEDRSGGESRPEYVIEWGTELLYQKLDEIVTALRLFGPDYGSIEKGHGYLVEQNWQSYRLGVEVLNLKSHRESTLPERFDGYLLPESEITEFQEFCHSMMPSIGRDEMTTSISRYNRSYEKSSYEDAIIDCFVALENLLLRNTNSSYAYRFPARGSLLLDNRTTATENVFEFFDALRIVRNSIIHEDQSIGGIDAEQFGIDSIFLGASGDLEPMRFVRRSRRLLAETIHAYVEIFQETGKNVTEVNRDIMEPLTRRSLAEPTETIYEHLELD